jgi:hypothetical protein
MKISGNGGGEKSASESSANAYQRKMKNIGAQSQKAA